ncbi:MAG: glycerate kinase [Saccharofermentanales bacterium]
MKKFLLIPDSFKGTMDSQSLCRIMEEAIGRHYPHANIVSVPVADGGEGTVDAFLAALGGQKIRLTVKGPLLEETESFYGLIDQGRAAVIEMAAAAGLPLISDRKDPLKATTFGVGQLILDAAARGVSRIIMGLGGSATNDGGCGAAAACGIRFLDAAGQAFIPAGGSLAAIHRIDPSAVNPLLAGISFTAMCDIDNPMFGPQGAARVFAPQKGANEREVEILDQGLEHLAALIRRDLDKDPAHLPGAGAAGAMGAGLHAFFGADLQSGIQVILDTVRFEELARDADLILTGEGRIDGQSIRGKAVLGIARRARKLGIPVVAIVGDIGQGVETLYDEGISGIFSINRVALDLPSALKRSQSDLSLTVDNLMRFIKRMEEGSSSS